MNNKKEIIKYSELFVYYQDLFTKKQKTYLTDYFLNDFSLQEIAKKHRLSVAAVADSIKHSRNALNYYENKLHLYDKALKRRKVYNTILNKPLRKKLMEIDKI